MSLLWSVPVVAAAVATAVLVTRARAIEEAGRELATEVARLRDLRAPLARVRSITGDTERLVSDFRSDHAPGPP